MEVLNYAGDFHHSKLFFLLLQNMVHWCGAQYHDLTAEHADLHTDLADLEAKENQLDDLIRNAELQLQLLNEDKTNAYVTYQVHL